MGSENIELKKFEDNLQSASANFILLYAYFIQGEQMGI